MPQIAGQLVTDLDCGNAFTPKGGYVPTGNNTLILDADTIFARYNVTIAGGMGTRCPSWDQLTSAISSVAYQLAFADCIHFVAENKTTYYSASPSLVVGQNLWKDAALTIKADEGFYTTDTHQLQVNNVGTITAVTTCDKVTLNWEVSIIDSPSMTNELFQIQHNSVNVVNTTVSASGSIILPATAPLLFTVRGDPAYLWIYITAVGGSVIYTNEGDSGIIQQSLSFTTGQSPIHIQCTISGF